MIYLRVGNADQLETITVTEAAEFLGISKQEITELVNKKIFQKIVKDDTDWYVLLKSEVVWYKNKSV